MRFRAQIHDRISSRFESENDYMDINNLRDEYMDYMDRSVLEGFQGSFKAACVEASDGTPTTPDEWVDAACSVYWSIYADMNTDDCQ